MHRLKLKIDWSRIYRAVIAFILLMMAGVLIQSLGTCLWQEGTGRPDRLIFLSFSLLVVLSALVLTLIGLVKGHTLDEVLEDLSRWWREKGVSVAQSAGRRLLYLLGAITCGGAGYMMWSISREPFEVDRWISGRLALANFCLVITLLFDGGVGLLMLVLAVSDPDLYELVMRGWPQKKEE